jgi:hypothetical protein
MPLQDFFWRDVEGRLLGERFPPESFGLGLLLDLLGGVRGTAELPLHRFEDALARLAGLRRSRPHERQIVCPRVFISHRRADVAQALRVAWVARQEGFYFWLDVLDPQLQIANSSGATSRAIALIIEMALLNCTHVLAVMTPKALHSKWVPYEYGRVKDPAPVTTQAAAWVEDATLKLPGYLYLGAQHHSEQDIRTWFRNERRKWPDCNADSIRGRTWIGGLEPSTDILN